MTAPPGRVLGQQATVCFFVDLPTVDERREIIEIHLEKKNRQPKNFDVAAIATETRDHTGSEIEELVKSAMFRAFADNGREVTTEDILQSIDRNTVIAATMSEKLAALRKWAEHRTKPASVTDTAAEIPAVVRRPSRPRRL